MSESLADIRSRIEALGMNFQFTGTIKTKMNGIERETWLLEYEGSQFVYVAGQKNVVLGWDVDQCPLGKGVIEDLQEEFAAGHAYYQEEIDSLRSQYQEEIDEANNTGDLEKAKKLTAEMTEELESFEETFTESGYTSWENFMSKWNGNLSRCVSPLRTADLGDMIVEVDSRYLEEDAPSLAEAVRSLKEKESPFTLATEDEWEYLCNGGARTLFRWGDTLKDVLSEIYNIGTDYMPEEESESVLKRPNMLGLQIAYDSYKNEIIDHEQYTKGGDGGCSLCGGDGAIYVLPCYTAFYREEDHEESYGLSCDYYSYRRILRMA